MSGFISIFKTGLKNDTITEIVNMGITKKGTLFPFNTTSTLKKLSVKPNEWFNAGDYFASTFGLDTGYMVTIDKTNYRVMRMDRKHGKVWVAAIK